MGFIKLSFVVILLHCTQGHSANKSCIFNHLTANCSFMDLWDIPQRLPTNITVLDLSGNVMTELKGNRLSRYRHLRKLYLDNNNIHRVHNDAFQGIGNLAVLSLAENKLHPTILTKNLFEKISNLEELYLNRNLRKPNSGRVVCERKTCKYPDKAFAVLENLKLLAIDLCEYSEFGKGFSRLKQLQVLKFDHCLACSLSNKTFENFGNSQIVNFSLSGCQQYKTSPDIQSGILESFSNVKTLDLSNSYFSLRHALELLYPFRNKSMDMINFHRVSLSSRDSLRNPFKLILTADMMKYMRTICVKTLILSYNGIVDFHKNSLLSFQHPECFENVVLSANSFTFNYNEMFLELFKLCSKSVNMKLLDYSYVPVQYLHQKFILPPNLHAPIEHTYDKELLTLKPKMTFFLPPKLETLRLTHVLGHSDIFDLQVKHASNLKHLDLSYFQFKGFPSHISIDPFNIRYLDMSGIDAFLYIDKNIISFFNEIETVILKDVNLDKIIREGKNIFRSFGNKTKTIDLSENHLDIIPFQLNHIMNLENLNLSSNSFQTFPRSLHGLENIKTLDLSHNRLIGLDVQTMKWLDFLWEKHNEISLFMEGNSFYCSCENEKFVKWLFKTRVNLDKNGNYSCNLFNGTQSNTDTVMKQFHEIFSQCNVVVWLRTAVICIVTLFILICSSTVLYQFRWRLTYFLYRKLKAQYLNRPMDIDYEYDVFVAYAPDSTDWLIDTLMPVLEQKWKLKVCVKDRDFPVGADRTDTVIGSIRSSKYVVFIITPGFVNRKWGRFEIDMAKYEMFEQRKKGGIIVIIKDGTTKDDVPAEFSLIWKEIVLIEWPSETEDNENTWFELKLRLNV